MHVDSIQQHKRNLLKTAKKTAQETITHPSPSKTSQILADKTIPLIQKSLQTSQYTVYELISVYARKILKSTEEHNNVSELMLIDALNEAKVQDEYFRKNGRFIGPLHGIPIALKDDFDVKGYDSSLGCVCACLSPKYIHAPVVELLKSAGAIVVCKTNVPWHNVSGDCSNVIFGRCTNPKYSELGCGGTSGGLASLISDSGITIGLGSDVIGGLRIPAANCDLFALKPTSGRFPSGTINNFFVCWETLTTVIGPMGKSFSDIVSFFQCLVDLNLTKRIDPNVVPLKFDYLEYETYLNLCSEKYRSTLSHQEEYQAKYAKTQSTIYDTPISSPNCIIPTMSPPTVSLSNDNMPPNSQSKKLRIGFFVHDDFFRATPPASRAVYRTVQKLKEAGHTSIPITPPSSVPAMILFSKLLVINNSKGCRNLHEEKEPVLPIFMLLKIPSWIRNVFGFFFDRVLDDRVTGQIIRALGLGPISRTNSWFSWLFSSDNGGERVKLEKEKEDFQRAYNEVWKEYGELDAIICPVHALPPMPASSFPYICAGASYSMIFSLLDYPVGVIPNITRVLPEDRVIDTVGYVHGREYPQEFEDDEFGIPPLPNAQPIHTPLQQAGRKISFNFLGILGIEEYNGKLEEGVLGAGVGIQVVGERFKEERVLGVMRVIEDLMEE